MRRKDVEQGNREGYGAPEKNGRYEELKETLRERLMGEMDYSRQTEDGEIREKIGELLTAREYAGSLNIRERSRMGRELFYAIRKMDVLQELLDDPEVTEIMVNGLDSIFVEKEGRMYRFPQTFKSMDKLQDVIQQIVAGCNRVVNEASPIVDARLENGSRVNVVLKPVALNGPIVTIRRFPENPMTAADLIAYGSMDRKISRFLERLVRARYNIFISGGTGSGKTTFLNVLSGFIPQEERIITIEDSAELQLTGIPNLVSMETRNSNMEGCEPIEIRDLIRTALRMRPDRVIVGEVRGKEAIDMMQALNCGHDGSMSTGHSNSAADMLTRLETMVLMGMDLPLAAVRRQIASGLDIMIHLGRLRDRSRKVLEIAEVLGYEDGEIRLQTLYRFTETDGGGKECVQGIWEKKGELKHVGKLQAAGMGIMAETGEDGA